MIGEYLTVDKLLGVLYVVKNELLMMKDGVTERIDRFSEMLDDGRPDLAEEMFKELAKIIGVDHPILARLRAEIEFIGLVPGMLVEKDLNKRIVPQDICIVNHKDECRDLGYIIEVSSGLYVCENDVLSSLCDKIRIYRRKQDAKGKLTKIRKKQSCPNAIIWTITGFKVANF